ncbi:MAG: ion transporter [Oligoflexales bacterium]
MNLKDRIYKVIFEAETKAGRFFDVILIICILASVLVIFADSIAPLRAQYGDLLVNIEWGFTILFTCEYFLRLYCIRNPGAYALSFFGLIDLFSILPTFISVFVPGTQYLLVIRILRVLRVFRVLKLVKYLGEAQNLKNALQASAKKIVVFLVGIFTLVVILGSIMYLIEGEQNGFTSIPRSIYWAIVTITTVGYGDISPQTVVGQALASLVMIVGFGIIAIPTGIVTAELTSMQHMKGSSRTCTYCSEEGHDTDAVFCKYCGEKLL